MRSFFSACFRLGLILSLSASVLLAQEQPFRIKEIGTPFINTYLATDYHAHEQTYGLVQAKTGLIYVAGVTGVIEFDGQNWSVDSRVSDDSFKGVDVSDDGRVYAVTKSLIGYFSPDAVGTMVFTSLNDKVAESFKGWGHFWQVNLAEEQVIFNSTDQLVLYDPGLDTTSLISPALRFGESNVVNDRYYVMDYGRGLMTMSDGQLELLPGSEAIVQHTVRGITSFSDKELLIASQKKGLYKYGPDGFEPWKTEVSDFLIEHEAFAVTSIYDQYFAVGTISGGMVIIDRQGKLIQKLDKSMGMGNDALIQNILLDKDGNLWVAQHGVISHIIINSPFTTIDERHGVNGYVLYAGRHKGKTYVLTATGTLVKGDNEPWHKLEDYKPFKSFSSDKQQAWMTVRHEDDFFIAGNDGLVQVHDNSWKRLYRGERLWAATALKSLPYMVLGSVNGNLFLFSKTSGQWKFVNKIAGFNQQMDFLEQTDDGNLWMTDSGTGVYKIKLNQTKDSVMSVRAYGPDDGLPDKTRNRVFRHKQGLYFATAAGVYEYNQATDSFRGVEKFNNLIESQYVFRLIEMQNGNVYGSLNPGGKALLKKNNDGYDLTFSPFQRIASQNSEYVTDLGTSGIWIAGSGIKHYQQDFNEVKAEDFKALLRSVRISNKNDSLVFGGAGFQPSIELKSKENAIQFTFSATYFDQIEQLEFQSYLEGSEKSWAPWSEKMSRNYTNLPHGNYTFRLRARNLYGEMSEENQFTFTISTPWYLTVWAYIFYGLLVIGIVWVIVRLNAQRLIKEKEVLEQVVLERTQEIVKQKEKAEQDKETIQEQADRLSELDKVKSRFFANISHELRTPLTLINAPLESLIENGSINDPEVRRTLELARKNGVSLLSLVEEILDLAKLEAGKLRLVQNPVRLKDFLSDILDDYAIGLESAGVTLKFNYRLEEDLTSLLDENKCGKIVRNLLSNALKYAHSEIEVMVRPCSDENGRFQVIVSDNGAGIDPIDLPNIFDRYYQSESPNKKAEGGTGIGLALAKELAELMNGKLSVKSELGDGATFTLELPVNEVKEEAIVPLTKADNEQLDAALKETLVKYAQKFSVDKPVLLVTEDHPEMRSFIAKTLTPYFSILQAQNGQEALKVLEEHAVDIVISDVMMPLMDGFELLEAIKKDAKLHQISIVMLTARADQEDRLHALTLGIDDYLTKPFSAVVFLARIKNILDNRIKVIREFKAISNDQENGNEKDISDMIAHYQLSEREVEVMQLLAKRYSNAEISERLFVSTNTIKYHVKNLYSKLGVTSRSEVADRLETGQGV